MSPIDIIILIGGIIALASIIYYRIRKIQKRKKNGGCNGANGCDGCDGCG